MYFFTFYTDFCGNWAASGSWKMKLEVALEVGSWKLAFLFCQKTRAL